MLFDMSDVQPSSVDSELLRVEQEILSIKNVRDRFGKVIRSTIDQLLDGERTGRYDFKQLCKTEKTHAGTLIEINLQREFGFADGRDMDFSIAGTDVDCKYSKDLGGWMIPPEALDEICLVVWANDKDSAWSAGLLRASRTKLTENGGVTRKGNRDSKYRLNQSNLHLVRWLWHKEPLGENTLLHLDPQVRAKILEGTSGQQRVNQLFRLVQGRLIRREVVRTVAQQADYMARIREDKKMTRARPALRQEGIIILGHGGSHTAIARALEVPVPKLGEFISLRITRALPEHAGRPSAELWGARWVVASPGDKIEPLLQPLDRSAD
ncbi:NaeI family type II restriction endonuclease [Actinomadura montaniterrae]|uniref:Restriction endonuclease n=1 Tax=Actinomadura montaniterrae TaxID=1803903 RepID=A0A6L3VIK8_9ACTN|nr:NaeI family type II restriction endonuclease [Actinomadura montaniterrae]KAB2365213.1 restriction endonuclease [Actinomadura montaniterrae]